MNSSTDYFMESFIHTTGEQFSNQANASSSQLAALLYGDKLITKSFSFDGNLNFKNISN